MYVPGHTRAPKLKPVVVWIHGGGYISGGTQGFTGADIQNGDDLIKIAAPKSDVVAVIIPYRLGLFGFLAGKEMKAGGALNAGLLDQEFALKWVQKHVGVCSVILVLQPDHHVRSPSLAGIRTKSPYGASLQVCFHA